MAVPTLRLPRRPTLALRNRLPQQHQASLRHRRQPPVLPTASIYRTFPGFPIAVPLGVTDPEGGPVACTVENIPSGAAFDAETEVLSWTPGDDQLGAFYVPFECSDDASPPLSVSGKLTFRVSARDTCVIPSCEPAS